MVLGPGVAGHQRTLWLAEVSRRAFPEGSTHFRRIEGVGSSQSPLGTTVTTVGIKVITSVASDPGGPPT